MDSDQDRLLGKIREFRALAEERYPIRKLLLYGSHARGEARTDSDIDVALIMDVHDIRERIRTTAALYTLAHQVDPAIEPRCISSHDYENCEPASILGEIKRTAIEVP